MCFIGGLINEKIFIGGKMEKLKEAISKVAPWILCWAMGLVTYFMAENSDTGFEALISIVETLK